MPTAYGLRHAVQNVILCIALTATFATTSPLLQPRSSSDAAANSSTHSPVDTGRNFGEPLYARTAFTVISLLCIITLAFMLGFRAVHLRFNTVRSMSFLRMVVVLLYVMAIIFIFSAAVVESGVGMTTYKTCRSAILLCLVFYVGSKILLYVFLVERAHSLRAPYARRVDDWVWVVSMLVLGVGFGSIAVTAFIWPVVQLHADRRCTIGLPLKVTVPLLGYDVVINIFFTGLFIYYLGPVLRHGVLSNATVWRAKFRESISFLFKSNSAESENPADLWRSTGRANARTIEKLLLKSLAGTVLVLLPTVGNLASLLILQGHEQGWLCFTICTLDVTWAVCVIHWLTVDPAEVDNRLLASQPSDIPLSARGSRVAPTGSDP